MIFNNIDFFNIEEIKEDGTLLRFKEDLILNLGYYTHQRGRFYGYRAIGSELRFKTPSAFFDVTFEAYKEDCKIYIFYGDYMDKSYDIKKNMITTLHIERPEKMNNPNLPRGAFDNNVIRIVIGYPGYIKFKELNTFGNDIILPSINDVPSKSLVIYGSSISHGSESLEYINSYAFILSRLLNINIYNKAIPGSCLAEKQMVDYISSLKADRFFIEFGINTLRLFEKDEYEKRLDYIINKIPNLLFTSIFKCGSFLDNDILGSKFNEFRNIAQTKSGFINPDLLFPRFEALSTDLLHPSDFGQMLIAYNLFDLLK